MFEDMFGEGDVMFEDMLGEGDAVLEDVTYNLKICLQRLVGRRWP